MSGQGLALFFSRMKLQRRLRAALEDRGYQEVITSALQPGAPPDPEIEPFLAQYLPRMGPEPGPCPLYLHPSPEMAMKRLLCRGLNQIYQIGPVFRQGEAGALHSPEFTMAEWYRTGWSWIELMAEVEEVVGDVIGPTARVHDRAVELKPPLRRIPVAEALARAGVDSREWDGLPPAKWREQWERAWAGKTGPWIARQGAMFLTHFPAPLAQLARMSPERPAAAERFELLVAGVEIANGASELTDPAEYRRRFDQDLAERAQAGRPSYPLPHSLLADLDNLGLPPCAGVALGLDRLAMIALGAERIEEVQALAFLG